MGDRRITKTAKLLLSTWNIGLFVIVWFQFYNQHVFGKYLIYGGVLFCFVYGVIYLFLCDLYKSFRIASTPIPDIVFGQTISFGIADLALYAECCLVDNHFVNIIPGAIAVVLQMVGTALLVTGIKQYMMRNIKPRKTLLIYGSKTTLEDSRIFVKKLLKKYDHLFEICDIKYEDITEEEIQRVLEKVDVVVLYEVSRHNKGQLMKICSEQHKAFYFTPRIEDILCQGASYKNYMDTPLMKYDYQYESISGYFGKRFIDLVLSVLCLLILWPILLFTAICIKLEDGGPIFYKQKRYTKDQKIFEILKFRSMIVDAEKDGAKPCTGNDSRITKVGKVIRATRIDELPQIFNILKGEMSFVGPRPERVEHVEQYTEDLKEFTYRLRVKGGLTGYAQIYGKYNTSAYDKLRLDLMYIENQSLLLDLKLILMTIKVVFTPESTEGFEEEKSKEINKKVNMNVEAPSSK